MRHGDSRLRFSIARRVVCSDFQDSAAFIHSERQGSSQLWVATWTVRPSMVDALVVAAPTLLLAAMLLGGALTVAAAVRRGRGELP